MQKKAIRLITRSKSNTPSLPLFSQLKILPLDHLITLTSGLLIHSIYHKYSPKALHNMWLTNEQREINQDLRDAHQLYIPFARTDHVKRLPFFSFPKIWNDLPDCKLASNPTTFKIALKFHLHEQVRDNCAWVVWFPPPPFSGSNAISSLQPKKSTGPPPLGIAVTRM